MNMKTVVTLFTVLLAHLSLIAQEHLSFKGVPIEGSMTEFCQKLKAKGLKLFDSSKSLSTFDGEFTGRSATIYAAANDDGKNVHSVMVAFEPSDEWNTLVNTYDYYKNLYTKKYGEPKRSNEYNPSRSDSNTALMAEVYQGTVEYISIWEVTGGFI